MRKEHFENERYRGEKIITDKPGHHYVKFVDKFFRGMVVKDQLTEEEANKFVQQLMEIQHG